jgi:integrase
LPEASQSDDQCAAFIPSLRSVSGLHPIGSRGLRALRGRLVRRVVPKGLPIEHVKRVLASCNRKSAIGRRDYAILLLLARLGLRAGEAITVRRAKPA